MSRIIKRQSVWAWALYDWGNSAYATTVMAGFFPLFFKEYWSAGTPVGESTLQLGIANSAASLLIVLMAPALGAIADRGGVRKLFLAFFACLGIGGTAALFFVGQGQWQTAVAFYALSGIGFLGSVIFYDALIVAVARTPELETVSALGYALGYLGGGILFAVNVAMTLWPAAFGLADVSEAVRWSFLSVAAWWLVFTLPLLLRVQEPPRESAMSMGQTMAAGFRQLAATFRELRRWRVVLTFLIAYWCYIDGVDTIVRMAVDYGLSLGFAAESLITALLLTQFVGFPAAIAFGALGRRLGPKTGIYIAIGVYCLTVIWGSRMESEWEFYGLATVIGLVQGGIQALSRALYARIIPADKSAEFFGFYNMLGKFAAVVGPLMMGWAAALTGEPRLSILTLLMLFGLGAFFLSRVDVAEGERIAQKI